MSRLGNVQRFWITALSLLTGLLYPPSVSSRYSSLSDPTLAYVTLLPKTPPVASPFTHSKCQGPTMAKVKHCLPPRPPYPPLLLPLLTPLSYNSSLLLKQGAHTEPLHSHLPWVWDRVPQVPDIPSPGLTPLLLLGFCSNVSLVRPSLV